MLKSPSAGFLFSLSSPLSSPTPAGSADASNTPTSPQQPSRVTRFSLGMLFTVLLVGIWLVYDSQSSHYFFLTSTPTAFASLRGMSNSGSASAGGLSLPPPRVCSHRTNNFPTTIPTPVLPQSVSADKLGALASLQAFLGVGVRCFDVDLFETADNVVHVGSAVDIAHLLGLNPPPATTLAAVATALADMAAIQTDAAAAGTKAQASANSAAAAAGGANTLPTEGGAAADSTSPSDPSVLIPKTGEEVKQITSTKLRSIDVNGFAPTLEEFLQFLATSPKVALKSTKPGQDSAQDETQTAAAAAAADAVAIELDLPLMEESEPLPPLFITFEPKPSTLRTMARLEELVQLFGKFPTLTEHIALIVHEPANAAALRRKALPSPSEKTHSNLAVFRSVQLAFPLLDRLVDRAGKLVGDIPYQPVVSVSSERGATDTSSLASSVAGKSLTAGSSFSPIEELCSTDFDTHPMKHRLSLLEPYDLFMPSYRVLHACGNINVFGATAHQHRQTLEQYLLNPKQRQPERNPLVQSMLESELRWKLAQQLEQITAAKKKSEASDSKSVEEGRHKTSQLAAVSAAAAKSESEAAAAAPAAAADVVRRKRLSVWNIDTSLAMSQVGLVMPTRSWSSFHQQSDHDSDRDINSNAALKNGGEEMTFTSANHLEQTHLRLATNSNDAIPIGFFISNHPLDVEKWIKWK